MGGRDVTQERGRRRWRGRDVVKAVSAGLMAAALVKELRKPREERTWHGALFGRVPYDLRKPTVARLKAAVWAPEDRRILVPRAFGVGWSPNVGRLVRLARERVAR
jgi:hypothetical protein